MAHKLVKQKPGQKKNIQNIVLEMDEHSQRLGVPVITPRVKTTNPKKRADSSQTKHSVSSKKDCLSISNYKASNARNYFDKESSMLKSKGSLGKSLVSDETRKLLSNHARKHNKAVEGTSPKTQSLASKSCNKTSYSSAIDKTITTTKIDTTRFHSQRPLTTIEKPTKSTDKSRSSNKEN